MSRYLHMGEKRYVGITVSHRLGEAFTVASATYTVYDSAGAVVESGTADIDGADVYVLFDTTATTGEGEDEEALYAAHGRYAVWFAAVITGLAKVVMGKNLVEIGPMP